jgi:hypothetical protein
MGFAVVVDTSKALEESNISPKILKFEIVPRHAYWDQEKLFDEKPEVKNLVTPVSLTKSFESALFASNVITNAIQC